MGCEAFQQLAPDAKTRNYIRTFYFCHSFLLERTVVGLLRLAVRLLRKEEISGQVLGALRVLLMMPLTILQACGRHISYGLHELLRTNAASIETAGDWTTIFTLLECVGAGVCPPTVTPGPSSSFVSLNKDGVEEDLAELTTSYDSDETKLLSTSSDSLTNGANGDSWLLIGKDGIEVSSKNQYNLTINEILGKHDSRSFVKSCQSLAFILRDAKHVSAENFLLCVHAVRVFGEALVDGGLGKRLAEHPTKAVDQRRGSSSKQAKRSSGKHKKPSPNLKTRKGGKALNSGVSEDEVEIYETINQTYDAMSLQLIELIYTLHTSSSLYFPEKKQGGEDDNLLDVCLLWTKCWCPLLQGIAQLCCDIRKEVRMSALTYLQRALLVRDLHSLGALEWEACFNKVMYPAN
jgi:brefeldin A-resistance guanine nucleotide exchange factor 1